MSDFSVRVVEIDEVVRHPNADRLDLARVGGWWVVVGRDEYKPGDIAVFFPIDSILPPWIEGRLFSGSKIKLNNSRIRTEKIRGVISQGLLAHLDTLGYTNTTPLVGEDLTEKFGVVKYEPKPAELPAGMQTRGAKRAANPNFHEYHDIPRLKNAPYMIAEGTMVEITEKIHGTNFRAGWVPFVAKSWWEKVKGLFGWNPRYEFVYGSRRVQLQNKKHAGFYHDSLGNVYWEAVVKYNLEGRIPEGVVVYGEVYGDGIQKGYKYGLEGERRLACFDVEVDGVLQNPGEAQRLLARLGLPTVPLLYLGAYEPGTAAKLGSGPSVLCPDQKAIEGVVVKTLGEPRRVAKIINEEYDLLQAKTDGTEFH